MVEQLPENIAASYPDRSSGDTAHQHHHDVIHGVVNALPQMLADIETATDGKLNDKVDTDDARLSDARTPLAHTHSTTAVVGLAAAISTAVADGSASTLQAAQAYADALNVDLSGLIALVEESTEESADIASLATAVQALADAPPDVTQAELNAEASLRVSGDAASVATASADATAKANAAQVAATSAAAGDATTKANAAQAAAISAAAAALVAHINATDPHGDRAYTDTQITALIGGAPGILDTFAEVAAQLGNDESAVAALTTAVNARLVSGNNLSDLTDKPTARTNLGLGTAAVHAHTDYQPSDAELSALASLGSSADRLPYFTGVGTADLAVLTAFARTLLSDMDKASARGTLGIQSPPTVHRWTAPQANTQWVIPANAIRVELRAQGGGGQGGSGRRGAAGSIRAGGGGGGGGGAGQTSYLVSELGGVGTPLFITVGGGGSGGGGAIGANDTNGAAGSNGGNSGVSLASGTFTMASGLCYGSAGGGGVGGTAGATAGGSGGFGTFSASAGAAASATGGIATQASAANAGASGGGGGGGVTAADAPSTGGFSGVSLEHASGGGAAGGALGTAGSPATTAPGLRPGGGGGGGGASITAAGGAGGAGKNGGGGGGGGASLNGFASGAGGVGGDGYVEIVVYYDVAA